MRKISLNFSVPEEKIENNNKAEEISETVDLLDALTKVFFVIPIVYNKKNPIYFQKSFYFYLIPINFCQGRFSGVTGSFVFSQ